MAEGVKLTEEEMALVKKLLEEKVNQADRPDMRMFADKLGPIEHVEDNDCFCDMDLDPSEATDDADLPPAFGGVVG